MATPFIRTNGPGFNQQFGTVSGGVATLQPSDSATDYTIVFQSGNQTVPVGACSVNQVLVGSGANTHASSANFTFNGTTLYANAKLNLGAVSNASPASGDFWYDTTKKTFASRVNGATSYMSGVIFNQTSSVTVANTTGETNLLGTGIGSATLPANFVTLGRSIRVKSYGYISTGAANTSATLRIYVGSATILTSTGSLPSGLSNALVEFDFTFRFAPSGTIIGQGSTKITSGAFVSSVGRPLVMTAPATITQTIANALNATYQWGTPSASNTITMTNATIEVIA